MLTNIDPVTWFLAGWHVSKVSWYWFWWCGCTLNLNLLNNRDGFELCKEIEQDVFLSCLELSVGQRKKIWVSMRNWTSDLPIPHSNALLLSHRDSTVSEVYHKVHVWHRSCLLMGNQKQKAGGLTPHGTQNFFFASCSWQNEKITFSNNL